MKTRKDLCQVSVVNRYKLKPKNGNCVLFVDFGSHDLCTELVCLDESS